MMSIAACQSWSLALLSPQAAAVGTGGRGDSDRLRLRFPVGEGHSLPQTGPAAQKSESLSEPESRRAAGAY
jgi:hypothetical protein